MKIEILMFVMIILGVKHSEAERKLMFTPYLSAFEDYSAQHVGEEKKSDQDYMGATEVGREVVNTSSPIPGGFSANMFQPGTYQTPMSHLGNTQPFPITSTYPSPFAGSMGQNQPNISRSSQRTTDSPLIQGLPIDVPRFQVREQCDSIKKQAVEISNAILNEQYKKIFKFLTKYLQSSQYLVGMSQVKLTRNLRRELYNVMHAYSSLSEKQVTFSSNDFKQLTKKEIEDALNDMDLDQKPHEETDLERGPLVNHFIPKI